MKTNYFWVAENYNKRYNRLFAIGRDAHEVLVHSNGVEVVCVAVLTDSDLKRVAQEAASTALWKACAEFNKQYCEDSIKVRDYPVTALMQIVKRQASEGEHE